MTAITANELFSSSLNFISMDEDAAEEARERFMEFQRTGVIKPGCSFEDKVWYTTDEYANVGFHFDFNPFSYRQYEAVLGLSFDSFIMYVKTFMVSILGKNALSTMQSVLLDLRHIVSTNIEDIYGASESLRVFLPSLCSDFFALLPADDGNEAIDKILNAMDSYADINLGFQGRQQRTLADFDTYFRFDELIKDFWKSSISAEERLFYYPLYLWWLITGVLPLRPREFLLTERDCLSVDSDGTYHLRLRRNQLKGGGKDITYKVSDDYAVDTYKIPEYLGKEIQCYKDLTEGFEDTEIKTLFVTDPHYRKWGQSKHSDSRYLTYMNMNTILKYFYREVICGKYGLSLVHERDGRPLADKEIGYIHLGDTRHIALINIMQEGGTPVTAMLLAGHNNTATASHYYSNLTSLIECKTYRHYRKMLSGDVQYRISALPCLPVVDEGIVLSDGGRCHSKVYASGSIDDCLDTMGNNGEIGHCPSCIFYRKDGSYFSSDDIFKRNLKNDCAALKDAADLVRQGKGNIEDLGEVMLRLRSSAVSYQAYLIEKHKKAHDLEE